MTLSKTAQAQSLPDWVIAPPQDTEQWFYSIGSGKTESKARLNALGVLSTRLSVTISASTQSLVSSDKNGQEHFFENDIIQQSESFTFNNINTEKSFADGEVIYALVKVDKLTFFEDLTQLLLDKVSPLTIKETDDEKARLRKLITWFWNKNDILSKTQMLSAYKVDVFRLNAAIDSIKDDANRMKSQLKTYLMTPAIDETAKAELRKHIRSFSTITPQPNKFKVVLEGFNSRTAKTDFHSQVSYSGTIHYYYDSELLYQKRLSASGFSENENDANLLANENLIKQIAASL
jgi:hypothetical protein